MNRSSNDNGPRRDDERSGELKAFRFLEERVGTNRFLGKGKKKF